MHPKPIVLFALAPLAAAVCKPWEVGVAHRWTPQAGNIRPQTLYSGSVVTNNCKILASNGQTTSNNQWCKGGYLNTIVDCKGTNRPHTVRDASGVN
ncbi:hypothetical protein QBC34DRAFT_384561 [Podospora aff. communis PSN243]|uniref:Uncharacterized protein n=1 Tax=Podospora aff. communis PSN243 TaxID=3040156 RepID=A0AAV9GAI7_9PEZI|nr:hypothetical protein QBC34DRAFT_384561 [Podospora aff. communis PSN243]